MPLIEKNLNSFKVINDKIFLNKDYLSSNKSRFKKITGTRFSAVLGFNKYNTEFKTWMGMVNLYKDDMDPTLASIGNKIEPNLRDYAAKELGVDYLMHNPMAIGFDAFKENPIFGGIPDGEPINKEGKIDYSNNFPMIEIKTSSIDAFVYKHINGSLRMQKELDGMPKIKEAGKKRSEWFRGNQIVIPQEYQLQLGLYLYLRNINRGMFVVGFLRPEDYVFPERFNTNDREIKMVEMVLDNKQGFAEYITRAQEWFNKYIVGGISPSMTEEDTKWLNYELALIKK